MICPSFIAILVILSLASTQVYGLKVGCVQPISFRKKHIQMSATDGYGPVGSLLRQGPVPFFIRIVKPETYNAAVEKYMKLEKCDRITAQANMDAYFQDPNGWAAEKLKSRKTGKEVDYVNANMSKGSLILTAIWSTGLFVLAARIFVVQVLHG